MRVVQIIDSLTWGGAQKMLSMLAPELISRQIDVVAVGLDVDDADAYYARKLRESGVEVVCIPGSHLFDLKRIRGLIRFFRQRRFDLVQTHLSYANMLGVLAGRLAGLPVVVTLHSTGVDRRYYNPIRFSLETLALRTVGVSVAAVGYAVAQMQQPRIGRKRITVIPNAITLFPELAPSERKKIRGSIIGKNEGLVLISVGRLSPDKGYEDMIAAFAVTVRSHPSARLVIVGDGVLAEVLKEQSRSLGLDGSVFFLGARDDVPALLKASDMYISASYREGMSMSLLEAMAAGLPIVTTNVGDASRMFTEDSAVLIQPGDPDLLAESINSLLADPDKMRNIGIAASERVIEQYGLVTWTDAYIKQYKDMLGSK